MAGGVAERLRWSAVGELCSRRRGRSIRPNSLLWVLRAEWTIPGGGTVGVGVVGRGWWLMAKSAERGGGWWVGGGPNGLGWLGAKSAGGEGPVGATTAALTGVVGARGAKVGDVSAGCDLRAREGRKRFSFFSDSPGCFSKAHICTSEHAEGICTHLSLSLAASRTSWFMCIST